MFSVATELHNRVIKPPKLLSRLAIACAVGRVCYRIATQGPPGFYEGETALLIETEMKAQGGLITRVDLKVASHTPTERFVSLGEPLNRLSIR